MPARNKPLTQRIIDAAPIPKTGFKELRESGLVLRLYATGGKAWSFEYLSPVTRKKARISFEAASLADARATVQRHRVAISEGKDPNAERKETIANLRVEHARTITVANSLNNYEPSFFADAPLKLKSRRDRMQRLRRVLTPLAARAVASLSRTEMILFLDEVQAASGPIARNRAHAEICAWLGWATERGHAPANVLDRAKKVSETSRKRRRVLTDAELAAMMSATADGATFSDFVRVLLHSAMRRDEAASVQPRWLDFEARTITIPPDVSKNSLEHVLPMADAIAPVLKERIRGLADDSYIFGEATVYRAPFQGWDKPTKRLRALMPEGDNWTLHDIRRTVATRLRAAGVENLVVEDLLGHISGERGGVAGIYNRAETLAKQAAALGGWADKLESLTNIVSLKRAAA